MNKKEIEERQRQEQKIKLRTTREFIQLFNSRPDDAKEYSSDSEIYYQPIGANKYLVVTHFNTTKKPEFQGYDLWLSEYPNSRDIGKIKALSKVSLKNGFDISKHGEIIEKYLPGWPSLPAQTVHP